MSDYALQMVGGGSGWNDLPADESDSGGIVSSLENLGVNLAAAAGTVGIQSLAKSQGVSSYYANPAAIAYNSSLLTQRPGRVSPVGAALGVSGNVLVFGGILLVGIIAFAAFRKKG